MHKLKGTLQCNPACCYWSFYTGEVLINRSCRDTQIRIGAFLNFQSISPDTALTHAPSCFIVVISAQRTFCPSLVKTVTFQHQLFPLPWVSCGTWVEGESQLRPLYDNKLWESDLQFLKISSRSRLSIWIKITVSWQKIIVRIGNFFLTYEVLVSQHICKQSKL